MRHQTYKGEHRPRNIAWLAQNGKPPLQTIRPIKLPERDRYARGWLSAEVEEKS